MPATNQIKDRRALVLVGAVLFLGLIVNALETKRTMCHDSGRSFEAAQIADTLRD